MKNKKHHIQTMKSLNKTIKFLLEVETNDRTIATRIAKGWLKAQKQARRIYNKNVLAEKRGYKYPDIDFSHLLGL